MSPYMYAVPLLDMEGKIVCFQVYGRDKISIEEHRKNLSNIKCLFQGLTSSDIIRPVGEIDILIGFEYAGYYSVREQSSDHLLILGNKFGCCIEGIHPLLEKDTRREYKKCYSTCLCLHADKVCIKDFYDTEAMDLSRAPKFGSCTVGGKPYTLNE